MHCPGRPISSEKLGEYILQQLQLTTSYQLRPMDEADRPFLYKLYASTREHEMKNLNWSEAQKDQFLRSQFQAQHIHYQKFYGDSSFDIIYLEDIPVGRLYVHRSNSEIRIVDIAILPQYRGNGAGTRILKQLKNEADGMNKALTIHVEKNNPAMSLYTRLGFIKVQDKDLYIFMQYKKIINNNKERVLKDA